jgi:hypothetical protein
MNLDPISEKGMGAYCLINSILRNVIKSRRCPMKKLIALMMVFFFLFGCSTTIIKSKPSGAKVYLDGKIKGETPYTYTSGGIWGTSKMVVLKKED